jgi:hypothetical protein
MNTFIFLETYTQISIRAAAAAIAIFNFSPTLTYASGA